MATRPYKSSSHWELDYLSKEETKAVVHSLLDSGKHTRQSLATHLGVTPASITHYLAGRARAPKRIKKLLPRTRKNLVEQPDEQQLAAIRAAQRVKNEEAIQWLRKLRAELPVAADDSELVERQQDLDRYRTHRKLFGNDRLS